MADQDQYLFIVTPNHSGSTWVQNVFLHCKRVVSFKAPNRPHNMEGQSIAHQKDYMTDVKLGVPNVWTEKEDYYRTKVKWSEVKKKWLHEWKRCPAFKKVKAGERVFLEKSPPNVILAQDIQRNFDNSYFIVMVRDPYAFTESVLRSKRSRKYPVERIVRHWVRCSKIQIDNIKKLERCVWFTYETLVAEPEETQKKIVSLLPAVGDLDFKKKARAHALDGSASRGLQDYNERQINRLKPPVVKEITGLLREHEKELEFFGYELR